MSEAPNPVLVLLAPSCVRVASVYPGLLNRCDVFRDPRVSHSILLPFRNDHACCYPFVSQFSSSLFAQGNVQIHCFVHGAAVSMWSAMFGSLERHLFISLVTIFHFNFPPQQWATCAQILAGALLIVTVSQRAWFHVLAYLLFGVQILVPPSVFRSSPFYKGTFEFILMIDGFSSGLGVAGGSPPGVHPSRRQRWG